MEHWIHSPPLLQRRVFFTMLLGIGSISIAGVMFFLSKDHILLTLSSLILFCCITRSINLLRIIVQKKYETVTGICNNISPIPLHRYRKIYLLDDAGNEFALLLDKRYPIKPGSSYRFYFQQNGTIPFGNDYLDAMFSASDFLGYEEWFPENKT